MSITRILHTPASDTYFVYSENRLSEVVTPENTGRHAEIKELVKSMTANKIAARAVVYTPKPVQS